MADDPDLDDVRRVLAGDVGAFERIVRRWQGPIVSLGYRMTRNRASAEDAAQEVFVKAFRGLSSWRGQGRFSSWLFALALNHLRGYLRRRGPALVELAEAGDVAAPETAGLEAIDRARDVRRAVTELPAIYRDAVNLYYLGERSVTEVAQSLRIPEGTLKARLSRAREMLRQRLAPTGPLAQEE
jgi:RNA polymerase sigma-70 factor (ECF subfamily)